MVFVARQAIDVCINWQEMAVAGLVAPTVASSAFNILVASDVASVVSATAFAVSAEPAPFIGAAEVVVAFVRTEAGAQPQNYSELSSIENRQITWD